jgi:uncharacterized protein with ParB-like and HNH nuclease domain
MESILENKREINTENVPIKDFLTMLNDGKFLVPSFQRYFVWDPVHICNLWDSIYHFYPIGSILYWKTNIRLHVHRKLGGFYIPKGSTGQGRQHSYILDGQQRATSLHISYFGGSGRVKDQNNFNYTMYFDATNATFFFENELYKHKWHADIAFLLPLRDIPSLPADLNSYLSGVPGFNIDIEKNVRQFQEVFADYRIPLIRLEGFDIASVCDIYERMNQTGMKLENLDIIIARGFQNNPTIIEEDFPEST